MKLRRRTLAEQIFPNFLFRYQGDVLPTKKVLFHWKNKKLDNAYTLSRQICSVQIYTLNNEYKVVWHMDWGMGIVMCSSDNVFVPCA